MPRPLLFLSLLAALLLAVPLGAQNVQGTLLEEGSQTPVPGALVTLLDAGGREFGSTLSDPLGRFALRIPALGTWRLRAERIGFADAVGTVEGGAPGELRTVTLRMAPRAVTLAGIVAETGGADDPGLSRRRCATGTAAQQTAQVWEEARKALRVAAWAQRERSYRFTWERYRRVLERGSLEVRKDSAEAREGTVATPFVSVPAERLIQRGFAEKTDDTTYVFYAPDAAVLLSDAFQGAHCFRVVSGAGEDSARVGLAFEPSERRVVPGVRGVLWLDRASAELSHLEFRYTRLPEGGEVPHVGGRLEFLRLPSGAWIVRRWRIRMPLLARGGAPTRRSGVQGNPTSFELGPRAQVVALQEEGGEVTAVTTPRGTPVEMRPRAALAGVVFDSVAGRPLAGARVRLDGTAYAAETDAEGRFLLRNLPDGSYGVLFTHPRADSLGFTPRPVPVTLRSGATEQASLALPPLERILAGDCPAAPAGRGALAGLVRDEGGAPVAGARIALSWQPAGQERGGETVVSDARGAWRACSVPAGIPLQLAVSAGGRSARSTVTVEPEGRQVASLALSAPAPAVPAGPRVPLTGRLVQAGTGRGVSGAVVRLPGMERADTTLSDGSFDLGSVPAGRLTVEVAHRGFSAARTTDVVVPEGGMQLRLETAPPGDAVELAPLVATAEARTRTLAETRAMGRRRNLVTREDIERRPAARHVGDLLRTVPRLFITDISPRGAPGLVTGVCVSVQLEGVGRCRGQVQVWIDGVRQVNPTATLLNFPPHVIESIEYFPPGSVGGPAGYSNTGFLVIKTRNGAPQQ